MSAELVAAPAAARGTGAGWLARVLAGLWVLAMFAGMGVLWRYKSTPGAHGVVPPRWPATAGLPRDAAKPTLIAFLHPACPCSRATIAELAQLLPRLGERVQIDVAALQPSVTPEDWNDDALRDAHESMPQAAFVLDEDGREAARFGVQTSGHVLLYGRGGELRYSGGVCAARGHQGDNAGLTALARALDAELSGEPPSDPAGAPVFGCSLLEPSAGGRP